jgi:hypothetical protein
MPHVRWHRWASRAGTTKADLVRTNAVGQADVGPKVALPAVFLTCGDGSRRDHQNLAA